MIIKAAKQIVAEFGSKSQWVGYTSKLREEQEELNHELFYMEYAVKPQEPDKLIDELADVIFILIQIIVYYKLSPFAILRRIIYKAKRTLERIASGYYNSCPKRK